MNLSNIFWEHIYVNNNFILKAYKDWKMYIFNILGRAIHYSYLPIMPKYMFQQRLLAIYQIKNSLISIDLQISGSKAEKETHNV